MKNEHVMSIDLYKKISEILVFIRDEGECSASELFKNNKMKPELVLRHLEDWAKDGYVEVENVGDLEVKVRATNKLSKIV